MKIEIKVDRTSVADAMLELRQLMVTREKANQICERLATIGAVSASLGFSSGVYIGANDVNITVKPEGNGFSVLANGSAVLFLEFGAGVTMGYGHPQAGEFGFGPGTYPGKGHWDDPNGWYIPGGQHTFGNPPNMAMYNASKLIQEEVERVCREVLSA